MDQFAEDFSGFKEQYVVLKSSPPRAGDPFSIPATSKATVSMSEIISIDTDEMTLPEVSRRSQERNVQAIAPVMPMKLIEPVSTSSVEEIHSSATNSSGNATWGVEAVGAANSSFTGNGITVAVLDTGIDAGHSAFTQTSVVQKDFTGEGNGDTHGHGTHCAGTICGNLNHIRIGVAPGIKQLLVGKVLGANGGSTQSIVNAILWSMDQGANVISMSLGTDFPLYRERLENSGLPPFAATSVALQGYRANVRMYDSIAATLNAQQQLRRQGVVVVAASGNESRRGGSPQFTIAAAPPSNADGFVSVGAIARDTASSGFGIADFSNTGANVGGPGVDIVSAAPGGGLVSSDGTSMATPHVAGIAALWAEKLLIETGRINGDELVGSLIGTASLPSNISAADIGSGLVSAP